MSILQYTDVFWGKKISYGETSNITSANTRWRRAINKQVTEGPASVDSIKKLQLQWGASPPTISFDIHHHRLTWVGWHSKSWIGTAGIKFEFTEFTCMMWRHDPLGKSSRPVDRFQTVSSFVFFWLCKEPPTWNLEESGA